MDSWDEKQLNESEACFTHAHHFCNWWQGNMSALMCELPHEGFSLTLSYKGVKRLNHASLLTIQMSKVLQTSKDRCSQAGDLNLTHDQYFRMRQNA